MWSKFFCLIGFSLLVGCASDVATDYDKTVNFEQYKTYQYWRHDDLPVSLDIGRIHAAVDAQMKSRGMEINKNDADLYVKVDILEAKELLSDGPTFGVGFGTGNFGVSTRTPERVRERAYGKIVVSFIDKTMDKMIWKSISQRQLTETMKPAKRNEFITEQVQAMFDDFPVAEIK